MTATAHAVIGTIIAAKIGNPALSIPIAIASHIVADAIPHWDTATNLAQKGQKKVIFDSLIDLVIGFILSYILIVVVFPKTSLPYTFFLILVSQSLDWLMVPYRLFNINFPIFRWSYKFQKLFDNRQDKPWGIINQVAVLILLVILAKVF
ncbi:MAG: hypothetical protein AAB600_05230 [Patescibacteria group bacterium]